MRVRNTIYSLASLFYYLIVITSDIDPQFLADPSGLISDRSEIDHAVNKAQIPFQYIPKNAKTGGGGRRERGRRS